MSTKQIEGGTSRHGGGYVGWVDDGECDFRVGPIRETPEEATVDAGRLALDIENDVAPDASISRTVSS